VSLAVGNHFEKLALDRQRALQDPRGLDLDGGRCGEPGLLPFVHAIRKLRGGIVHLLPHLVCHYVDNVLSRCLDVAQGILRLPVSIRQSKILTGNNLGQLANVHEYPVIDPSFDDDHLKQITQYYSINPDDMENELHSYAKKLLDQGKVKEAWQVLLAGN